jgi:hypothetical protein
MAIRPAAGTAPMLPSAPMRSLTGEWLAEHIPGATFTLARGHGHFSAGVANRDEILRRPAAGGADLMRR